MTQDDAIDHVQREIDREETSAPNEIETTDDFSQHEAAGPIAVAAAVEAARSSSSRSKGERSAAP